MWGKSAPHSSPQHKFKEVRSSLRVHGSLVNGNYTQYLQLHSAKLLLLLRGNEALEEAFEASWPSTRRSRTRPGTGFRYCFREKQLTPSFYARPLCGYRK